jgi:hypothetical protein
MCSSRTRYVSPRTIISVSRHNKNQTKCVGLIQTGHHLIKRSSCSRRDTAEKLLILCQTAIT